MGSAVKELLESSALAEKEGFVPTGSDSDGMLESTRVIEQLGILPSSVVKQHTDKLGTPWEGRTHEIH